MKKTTRHYLKPTVNTPKSIPEQIGPGVKAWVFGAVVQGAPKVASTLEVYVAGPDAEKLEAEYFGKRPWVTYEEGIYRMRLIGPATVPEEIFIQKHPEAIRLM